MVIDPLRKLLKHEAAGGVLLALATVLAMVVANSPAHHLYQALLETPLIVQVGTLGIAKPLLLWINDGLMAIFFFLVGLELKREVLQGELSSPSQIVLPILAALGGMAMPASLYALINWGDPVAMKGWAIPTATDIAFALGVLSLFGRRVPGALKVFLLSLAIIDDLGAILIIALFYTEGLSLGSLIVAGVALLALAALSRRRVTAIAPYALLGVVLWVAVLKSGVHATLAGVLLALFIPMAEGEGPSGEPRPSPLRQLEHDLHPTVAYVILPVFAFANTGISLENLRLASFTASVPMGIWLGLVVGKLGGVFGLSWLAIRLGWARLPKDVGWLELFGVSALTGIGFTMSLFISSLAFEQGGPGLGVDDRLAILAGTLVSATFGYLVLRYALSRRDRRAAPSSTR